MARDDWDVVSYKILAYYLAWTQGKIVFNDKSLRDIAGKDITDVYFEKVLRSLVEAGYIEGITYTRMWGNTYTVVSDLSDGNITAEGARYINDNSRMKQAEKVAIEAGGMIIELLPKLGL